MIKFFSIFNKTLKQYYSPFADYNVDGVKKQIFEVVNAEKDNYISLAPANYCIFEIGEFNPKNGKLDGYNKPKLVIECAELVLQEASNE